MVAAAQKKLVTFADLQVSGQFTYDITKGWTAKHLSADAGNLLTSGSEAFPTVFLGQAAVRAAQANMTVVHDATNNQLVFDDGNGHQTVIPVSYTDSEISNISLAGTKLTIAETNGAASKTIDLAAFMQMIASTNTAGIALSGTGHDANSPLTATLLLDATAAPVAGFVNMIKMKATGAVVDPADIVTLMNAKTTVSVVATAASGVVTYNVNGQTTTLPIVQLVDSAGNALALAFAPA